MTNHNLQRLKAEAYTPNRLITQLAGSQEELELEAAREFKKQKVREVATLGEANYFSRTDYGVKLVKRELPRIAATLQDVLQNQPKKVNRSEGLKALRDVVVPLLLRVEADFPGYCGDVYSLLALIGLKSVVDTFASTDVDHIRLASVVQRIGSAVNIQFLDAVCLEKDPEAYHRESIRWNRQVQGVGNKHTNLQLGQRKLLGGAEQKKALSLHSTAKIGGVIVEVILQATEGTLFSVEKTFVDGCKHKVQIVVPTPQVMNGLVHCIEEGSTGALRGYPMQAPPIEWQLEEGVLGIENHSGGYHGEAFRQTHPMVRTRFGDNETRPSQLLVNLLNLLGRTEYRLDTEIVEAFNWAIDHRMEVGKLRTMPERTTASMKHERDIRESKQVSEEERRARRQAANVPDRDTEPDAHALWKKRERDAYNKAALAEKRFIRTQQAKFASLALAEYERVFFSWSADFRGRVYPAQGMVSPQGTDVEKSLLRFAKSEQLTDEGLDEVFVAISNAFRGGKRSWTDHRNWGRDNIDAICEELTEEPEDIKTLKDHFRADDCWAALQLCRGWVRYRNGEGWDVPVGVDASQSGTQILAGLLQDGNSLLATNGLMILPAGKSWKDLAPEDGYKYVLTECRRLLDAQEGLETGLDEDHLRWVAKHPLQEATLVVVRDLVKDGGAVARKLAKAASMPRVYGSKWQSTQAGILKRIEECDSIDIVQAVKEGTYALPTGKRTVKIQGEKQQVDWTPEAFEAEVIARTTSYLRRAVEVAFPLAMQALAWLVELGKRSIEQQRAAGEHPKLSWTLSDGMEVSYWKPFYETTEVRSREYGKCVVATGDNGEVNDKDTLSAFAPSFVHSLDALVLRVALEDWDADVVAIHDCLRTTPNNLMALRQRLMQATYEVVRDNPLEKLASDLGVSPEELPLPPKGDADIRQMAKAWYSFH